MTYGISGSLDRVPKYKLAEVCLSGKLAIAAAGVPVLTRRIIEQQKKAAAVFKSEADRLLTQLANNLADVAREEGKAIIEQIRLLDGLAKQAVAAVGARAIARYNMRKDLPPTEQRPANSTNMAGHSRSAAPRTRTTGHNAVKSAAGDSGDPDPEPRHPSNPICNTRLIAANDFRMEVAA